MKGDLCQAFIDLLPKDSSVLDVGAGLGAYSIRFAQAGCRVVAIDEKPCPDTLRENKSIEWIEMDIKEWLLREPKDKFHGIFIRNVIQFLSKPFVEEILIPRLRSMLEDNGVVAIQTFSQAPVPPFLGLKSFYSSNDLSALCHDMKIELLNEYTEDGTDMKGAERTFHISEIVAR